MLNEDYEEPSPTDPIARFEHFFRMYEERKDCFVYLKKINKLAVDGDLSINVDFHHLMQHDLKLARDLHEHPSEYLIKANQALVNLLHIFSNGRIKLTDERFVRFHDLPKSFHVPLSKKRVKNLGKLISITGMLLRASDVKPEIKVASFECKQCGARHNIEQIDDDLVYPGICNVGGCKNTKRSAFRFLENYSETIDYQRIRIQEDMHELAPGRPPRYIDCVLKHDIVDKARPGDLVIITGVIHIQGLTKGTQIVSKIFRDYFEVNSIKLSNEEAFNLNISKGEMEQIKGLAWQEFIHSWIASSIAPNIYGMEDEKLAVALALFGGVTKYCPDGTVIRGNIHVLLMGPGGTGKSRIIKSAASLSPRGMYSSAKGHSAAGLTAAVVKDEVLKIWVLEAGILPLCDGGVACIDELEKARVSDRDALYEAMSILSCSIAKAGIKATLSARVTVITCANPRSGRWNPNETLGENIDLPPPLLSRFDLIFIVRDIPEEKRDEAIADHILKVHSSETIKSHIEMDLLRKYIFLAKDLEPELSDGAKEEIKSFYLGMRKNYNSEDSPVPIGARSIEGLIRLSKAYAKMALRETVTRDDVKAICTLVKKSMLQTTWDETTGKFDQSIIQCGMPVSKYEKARRVYRIILDLQDDGRGKPVHIAEIIQACVFEDIKESEVKDLLLVNKEMNQVYETKGGLWVANR